MDHRNGRRGGALGIALAMVVVTAGSLGIGAPAGLGSVDAATTAAVTTIAVVGDFGKANAAESSVAALITGWSPDAVLGAGDDYYAVSSLTGTDRYDLTVGKDYCAFLKGAAPGTNCPSGGTATTNRFWSATGNHDYNDGGGATPLKNYLDYFPFPSNERYYSVTTGPVEVFFIDSQAALGSAAEMAAQQAWLQAAALASTAPWQVVVLHHPPYSSGSSHGSSTSLRWAFADWGIDLVVTGHDHTYERSRANGVTYIVNGLGGASPGSFTTPTPQSLVRYSADHGALKLLATDTTLDGQFISLDGTVRDGFSLTPASTAPTSVQWGGETWSIKTSASPVGPGPNVFAADNAWTDGSGYLHLRIDQDETSAWTSAEVIAPQSLGYGTYTFTLGSRVDSLDRNAVLGLFTWSDQAAYANREIDIEFARWGVASDPTNAQYVVQPFGTANHLVRFRQPSATDSTHAFTWSAGDISWESRDASGGIISAYQYRGADVPVPGDERVRLNLWLYNGAAPAGPQEVVIRSFSFTPLGPPVVLEAFGKSAPLNVTSVKSTTATYPMTFAWGSSAGALGYRICVDQKNNGKCDAAWELTTGTTLVKSLSRGKTYYWQVQAFGPAGSSPLLANGSAAADWWRVSITR